MEARECALDEDADLGWAGGVGVTGTAAELLFRRRSESIADLLLFGRLLFEVLLLLGLLLFAAALLF